MRYTLSIDLGTQSDFTVMTLIKRVEKYGNKSSLPGSYEYMNERAPIINEFHVPFIERPDMRTPYPVIADRILEIVRQPGLVHNTAILVDATGVGLPVIQMMRERGLSPIPITITGGYTVTQKEAAGGYGVPKRDLIQALNAVIQTGRLKVSPKLKYAEQLRKEMLSYKMRMTKAGNTQFEANTESTHDDMVMSIAMGAWWMERIYGSKTIDFQEPTSDYDELTYGL